MPFYPEPTPETDERAFFINTSQEQKIISEYTGLNFAELDELHIFDYWRYLHDAVIYNCNQTEKGHEYLHKAALYAKNKGVDKPDRAALAEFATT